MTYEQYNAFCSALPASFHVVQWGGSQVWKVGAAARSKVFAIGGWERASHPAITFKVSEIGWEVLRDAPGCQPAPYLASRGLKWIQSYDKGLKLAELKAYLRESHRLAAASLPKRVQTKLGL